MNVSESEICDSALKKFGLDKQIIKCIEELSELQKELCKQLWGQGNLENIKEEIADVEITIEQMKIGLKIKPYDIYVKKVEKLKRLNDRVNNINIINMIIKHESKCRVCRFFVMTGDELQALGGEDPCKSCRDLSNWKPKEAECNVPMP